MRTMMTVLLLAALGAGGAESYPPASELPVRPQAPDPLVMLDGKPVTTKTDWFQKRRPELRALFQHYMYGWFPPSAKVTGKIIYTDKGFFDGKVTLKLATLILGEAPAPQVHLLMVIPNRRPAPAPIFLGMNFSGNHSLVADTHVPVTTTWMLPELPHMVEGHATEAGRGAAVDTWALEQSIDRGYAVATFFCGEVEEDRTNAVGGVREMIQVARAPDAWGTIAAWAWELLDRVVRPAPRPARRGGRGHLGQSGRGLRHVASGQRGVSFDRCRGSGRVHHARDQPID
jgi:hypothetical protein